MRHARAVDYRRRLVEKSGEWTTRITQIAFSDVRGLGSGEVNFTVPVSVICGPNGVGKSTLLKLIWAALNPEGVLKTPTHAAKLASGSGVVNVTRGREELQYRVNFPVTAEQAAGPDLPCVHVDTSSDVGRIQAIFAPVTDLEAFLNGMAKVALEQKEITEISYVTRRLYNKINVSEIELAEETLPFFEVELDGQSYDSRTMGSGEFAAFFLWWHLRRAEKGTVFLIEEPESYLSPDAREAFMNVLLKFAYEQELYVLMTSHSTEIITPLPADAIRFFRRERDRVALIGGFPSPVLLKTIGIRTRVDILAFVEDEAAKTFARLWMEKFDPTMAKRFEIHVKGSDGEIIRTIKTTKLEYECVTILGLFDGDAREKVPKALLDRSAFLPGNASVEQMFREFVQSDPAVLSARYGWGDLRDILFAIQADDPHDWFEHLAKEVGVQKNMLFMAIFSLWLEEPANELMAREAFDALSVLLNPSVNLEPSAETGIEPLISGVLEVALLHAGGNNGDQPAR